MKHIGITITDRGSAIVTVERSPDDALLVVDIERLPFSLAAVTDRVRALEADAQLEAAEGEAKEWRDPEARFIVDAEGLGSALWAILGSPDDAEHWTLYTGRGLERQALADALLVAVQQGRFHFASGLAEQDAMSKALLGYRRQVREDGLIGSELVVALLLAVLAPPPPPVEPAILFGRSWDSPVRDTPFGTAYRVSGPPDDD